MKSKNLLYSGIAVFFIQFLFSCSSAEYYRFAPTQQEAYKKVKEKPSPAVQSNAESVTISEIAALTDQTKLTVSEPEPMLEASAQAPKRLLNKKTTTTSKFLASEKSIPVNKTELKPREAEALALVQSQLADLNKSQKKELKSSLKEVLKEAANETKIVEIILAVLIPPLAVFLHEGELNSRFWISLLLTILFFVPGVIYALLVVTDSI